MRNAPFYLRFFVAFLLLTIPVYSTTFAQEEDSDGTSESPSEQQTATDQNERTLPETVVTETRVEEPVSEVTRSVTVLNRAEIERETAISRDVGDLLGRNVPGMATSTQALTNFTQTLRGRKFLVLIDGVPISSPLRDGARDAKVLSPEAIERVEVIRGGTAVYGFGATGGIVNYRTREAGDEEQNGFSQLRLEGSTEEPDDSLHVSTSHGAYGEIGSVDYLLNASAAERNSFYDSDGDRIPPEPFSTQGGLADTQEWNVLAKSGYDFHDGNERVEVVFNNYDIEQETDFVTQNGNVSQGQKAIGVPGDPGGKDPTTESTMARINYSNDRVLGSTLKLNTYYLDRTARFGFSPSFQSQSELETERLGSRLTINTPLVEEDGPELIWGVDTMFEETQQTPIAGSNPFGIDPVPEMDTDALAGFAQLSWPVYDIGKLRTGVRHEQFWMDVDDYSNFENNNMVEGGDLRFNDTLFNLTGVVYLTEQLNLFGGFSQGFAPSEVGRVLREQADSGNSVEDIDPDAQTVDNYELGLRKTSGDFTGAITGFFSESDLGTGFDQNLQVTRNPEEIWGIEVDLEYDVTENWRIGNTTTWIESATDEDGDGDLDEELPNTRVPPVKVTGFVEYRPTDRFRTRLRGLFSDDRDPDSTAFGSTEVDAFKVFDLFASYQLNPGTLSLGVENLLNEEYFPVANQAFGLDSSFSRASGRTVSLSYQLNW